MTTSAFARAFVVLGFSALLYGCSGTQWSQVQTGPAYQAPKQVKVAIMVQAKDDESLKEAVQSLKDSLTKELTKKGITATFVAAPHGTPSTDLTVAEWDEGSRRASRRTTKRWVRWRRASWRRRGSFAT